LKIFSFKPQLLFMILHVSCYCSLLEIYIADKKKKKKFNNKEKILKKKKKKKKKKFLI